MRAALLQSPQTVVMADVPPPDPAAGQVRVKLEGAGICASELPLWEGREWFEYPRAAGAPGHEGWGKIDALGDAVNGLERGQRVALISEHAHAEFDLADAANVVALPSSVPSQSAFPGEPLACAVNAMRRAGMHGGERVAIVGAGFQGLLLVQLSAALAAEVAVISRRESALELAASMGATVTWRPDDGALQDPEPFDVVFEVTGYQQPLDLASRLTRVRGRLVIVGYHQDGRRSVDMQLWNWRGLDVINAHERDPAVYASGLRAAIEAVEAGRLDVGRLITHEFALDEIASAYEVSARRPDGFVKAVWVDG